ncbi:hypothetical protein GIB67_021791, partial [Kingdonia uniflora]
HQWRGIVCRHHQNGVAVRLQTLAGVLLSPHVIMLGVLLSLSELLSKKGYWVATPSAELSAWVEVEYREGAIGSDLPSSSRLVYSQSSCSLGRLVYGLIGIQGKQGFPTQTDNFRAPLRSRDIQSGEWRESYFRRSVVAPFRAQRFLFRGRLVLYWVSRVCDCGGLFGFALLAIGVCGVCYYRRVAQRKHGVIVDFVTVCVADFEFNFGRESFVGIVIGFRSLVVVGVVVFLFLSVTHSGFGSRFAEHITVGVLFGYFLPGSCAVVWYSHGIVFDLWVLVFQRLRCFGVVTG